MTVPSVFAITFRVRSAAQSAHIFRKLVLPLQKILKECISGNEYFSKRERREEIEFS